MDFPVNPTDKMIFESSPGIYFQYTAKDASWTRLQGYGAQLDLATPLQDGLMSKEDYVKLNGLMLPPPKTTMTADGCNFTFREGVFGFRSSQKHLTIETELPIVITDKDGNKVTTSKVWKIHDNTYGINFKVNLPVLLSELDKRGKLTYRKTIGPAGKKGEKGDPGINQLETGPKGLPGEDGKNAPFDGALLQDTTATVPAEDNRGIVDIYTEQISRDENYLVAVRANLGNPNLCPSSVRPKKITSKWIVVTDERPPKRKALGCTPTPRSCITGPGCIPVSQQNSMVVQSFCSTQLYYLDITGIEEEIQARFEALLADLKATKEKMVLDWLKTMITIFNEQKLALCCAIENCESRRENTSHRQYIETQRMQGAIAGVGITVEGNDGKSQQYIDTNPGKNCPPPPGQKEACNTLSVSCFDNQTADKAASIDLLAGTYEIELSACCGYSSDKLLESEYLKGLEDIKNISPQFQAEFKKMTPYSGVVKLTYQTTGGPKQIDTPNKGQFHTSEEAVKAYSEVNFSISHAGGPVKAYFPLQTSNGNSGKIDLCFRLVLAPIPSSSSLAPSSTSPSVMVREMSRDVQPSSSSSSSSSSPCPNPLLELDLNCSINVNDLSAVSAELPLGDYVAEISDCCCTNLMASGTGVVAGNSGAVALQYQTDSGAVILYNPDFGSFSDLNQALAVYMGNTFMFHHVGGEIKVWVTVRNPGGNAGEIKVRIANKDCVNIPPPTPFPSSYVPHIDEFDSCNMTLDQLLFYEGGWKAGACCGVLVIAGGTEWIVVKRSIGTDTSCGGGESIISDCISQGAKFGFYPGIAYPTIDGKHFFGKPSGGVQIFRLDDDLTYEILKKIQQGEVIKTVGVPQFDAILFPHAS